MKLLPCLLILLPLQALGASLVIPAEPDCVAMQSVKFYHLSYGFREDEPGRFQLQVNLRYRKWTSRIERVQRLTFRLQAGTIVQRDDHTLVLRIDKREIVVGQHQWWYSPYWQTVDDVRIACDHYRRFRRVVIENCRLIVM